MKQPKPMSTLSAVVTSVTLTAFATLSILAWRGYPPVHNDHKCQEEAQQAVLSFMLEHLHTEAETRAAWNDIDHKLKHPKKLQNIMDIRKHEIHDKQMLADLYTH